MLLMSAAGLLPAFDLTAHRLLRTGAALASRGLRHADDAALLLARRRAQTLRGRAADETAQG